MCMASSLSNIDCTKHKKRVIFYTKLICNFTCSRSTYHRMVPFHRWRQRCRSRSHNSLCLLGVLNLLNSSDRDSLYVQGHQGQNTCRSNFHVHESRFRPCALLMCRKVLHGIKDNVWPQLLTFSWSSGAHHM